MNVFVRRFPLLIITLAGLIAAHPSNAQSVATAPVGYVQIACTGSSDSLVSVPFTQPAAYAGTVQSISGNVITVNGTTGWTASQFVYSGSGSTTYFVLLGAASSGTDGREGASYTITASGTNTLTVSLNGDSLSSVPVGTAFSIIPYWTIATVFPSSNELSVNPAGSFAQSTSTRLSGLNTQILLPDYSGSGTNLSPANLYYYYGGKWNLYGDTNPSHYAGDDILANNGYFIVRNANTANTSLTTMGSVVTGKVLIPLATEPTVQQDNQVSLLRPVDVPLNSLGLAGSTAFTTSTSTRLSGLGDELLLFSNSAAGTNKSPSSLYYYYQGHWALYGDPNGPSTDHGTDTIPAGTAFIVRKAPTGTGATAFWQHSATY